jgi:hypothetical protein
LLIAAGATLIASVRFWTEKDTFKLAIQGCAYFEKVIDAGIEEALPGEMPDEVRHLSARVRLALAEALGLVTPETRRLARALAKIRNEFAHGDISELDLDTARSLIQRTNDVFGADPVLTGSEASPHMILTSALITAVAAASTSIAVAVTERARRDAALEAAVRSASLASTVTRLIDEVNTDSGESVGE